MPFKKDAMEKTMHTPTAAHPTLTPASKTKWGTAAMQRFHQLRSCLALTGALACPSIQLGKLGWLQFNGISALTLAIVLGVVVGNTVYPRIGAMADVGLTFSKANLLRLGTIFMACARPSRTSATWAGPV
ncbi:putative sulfate exporter family transporter [Rhodoferax sp.]|uniref:putative sulfate exporter family transporter n=1 Tax=Rhodoferax sp. TaxID=50421 RepID=UPI0025E3830B|nr:putative sulfate exporter family transporter [Rhodoferax sp.]